MTISTTRPPSRRRWRLRHAILTLFVAVLFGCCSVCTRPCEHCAREFARPAQEPAQ